MSSNGNRSPLLGKELVEVFHHLEEIFPRLASEVPLLRAHPGVAELADRFERLRGRLGRVRLQVGLLGQVWSSRSTVLERLLGPLDESSPTLVGGGGSWKGTVTRYYRKSAEQRRRFPDVGQVSFKKFLTPGKYRERRRSLCRTLGLDPDLPDAATLEKSETLGRRGLSAGPGGEPDVVSLGCRALASLIDSFRRFGAEYVHDPARVEIGEVDRRAPGSAESPGTESTPYDLLDEVEIACETEAVPEGLEFVELCDPGLLTPLDVPDDLVLLADLDGALVHQIAEETGFGAAREVLRRLEPSFSSPEDGVWLVVTDFDTLADATITHRERGTSDCLADLCRLTQEARIPPAQVILLADGPLPEGAVSSEDLDRQPAFRRAVEEVLRDGGTTLVRELVHGLAERLGRRGRDELGAELLAIREGLVNQIRLAMDTAGFDNESLCRAVLWRVALQQLDQQMAADPWRLEGSALALIDRLQHVFSEQLCPAGLQILPDRLPRSHKDYAYLLTMEVRRVSGEMVLRPVLDRMTTLLEQIESDVGKVGVKGYPSPLDAWRGLRDGDIADPGWYLREFKAFDERLFADEAGDPQFTVQEYRTLMQRKISVTVHRATHVLAGRIAGHLAGLAEDLTWLGGAENLLGLSDLEALQRLHDELSRSA